MRKGRLEILVFHDTTGALGRVKVLQPVCTLGIDFKAPTDGQSHSGGMGYHLVTPFCLPWKFTNETGCHALPPTQWAIVMLLNYCFFKTSLKLLFYFLFILKLPFYFLFILLLCPPSFFISYH